jgi:hypothetical protein
MFFMNRATDAAVLRIAGGFDLRNLPPDFYDNPFPYYAALISLLLVIGRADARRARSISRLSQDSLQSRRLTVHIGSESTTRPAMR